jgi:hypothetical protein
MFEYSVSKKGISSNIMKNIACEIIEFPKKHKSHEYVDISFDDTGFLMPVFIHVCKHYEIKCYVEDIREHESKVTVGCSPECYSNFLFPKFEYAAARLHDYFTEDFKRFIADMPMILEETGY